MVDCECRPSVRHGRDMKFGPAERQTCGIQWEVEMVDVGSVDQVVEAVGR